MPASCLGVLRLKRQMMTRNRGRSTAMHRRRLSAFVASGAVCIPGVVYGQFTDPRTYANTPAGVSQLEIDYGRATADDSIDTSLVIAGSHLEVNEAPVAYTRTFDMMHQLAWVKASVPFAYVS